MREFLRITGLSLITAAFAFCFYLATTVYGQARYEQGIADGARQYNDYLNKQIEKQQQDKCLRT